jgi:four helix bundle protein
MYEVTSFTRLREIRVGQSDPPSAVSLTNNIAEGHGHYPDQIRFILHSRGSLEELVDDLNVCLDERYVPPDEVAKLREKALDVLALLNGYLRYLRSRSTSVHEPDESYSESIEQLDALPL